MQAEPTPPEQETQASFDARMFRWRDVKSGLFIHGGTVSLLRKELSWSRADAKPLDITGSPVGAVEYPRMASSTNGSTPRNSTRQWVKIAQNAGMKYIVFTCKHHDGFSLFDSRPSEYFIVHTPSKRDVVKELADACHAARMRFGVYYSPRNWHQPDYEMGDNRLYVSYMNGQLREFHPCNHGLSARS